jgi:uncharacterized Zn-binding protein involved in type VI secretion
MRRYNITDGAKTTAGGTVSTAYTGGTIDGRGMVREGDLIFCPACSSRGRVVCSGPRRGDTWDGSEAALEGDLCLCKCDPPPQLLANQFIEFQDIGVERSSATSSPTGAPDVRETAASFSAAIRKNKFTCVFAKSCVSVPTGSTAAGTAPEHAENFGTTAVMASTGASGAVARVAGTLGSDLGTWAIRGFTGTAAAASSARNVVLLAFWPRDIGDSTLYTPQQLARMRSASTRVRFQFRQDESGELRVYGIHTKPESGVDRVPVAQAKWNADNSAMEAVLNGISITWTPNHGPVVSAPSPYPSSPERLDNLFVHPVAVGQDSVISHYPGREAEDVTWQDTIISFPADSGLPPLYLVFAKPAVRPLEVDIYGAFSGRLRNGLHIDHMPSQAAIRRHLERYAISFTEKQLKKALNNAASIAIPSYIHQKFSETYGWRNTEKKQTLDADNLRQAADSNFDAIKPYLLDHGFAESDLEMARTQMHKVNENQGWY